MILRQCFKEAFFYESMGLAKLFENVGIVAFGFISIAFFCFIIIWQGFDSTWSDAAGQSLLVAAVIGLGLVLNALLRGDASRKEEPVKNTQLMEKEELVKNTQPMEKEEPVKNTQPMKKEEPEGE